MPGLFLALYPDVLATLAVTSLATSKALFAGVVVVAVEFSSLISMVGYAYGSQN